MRSTARSRSAAEIPAKRRRGRRRFSLALIVLGALLFFRFGRRCHAPAREDELRRARRALDRLAEGAEEANHRLGTIRGLCEVAKMKKGENGDDLARRMDAAIDTVDETAALFRQLLACGRRWRAAPEDDTEMMRR